ncbi:hypothetical protein GQ593_09315 [Gilliamella sp. Pas-s25]|nr:hypothetical protein [Gilliamella sp. Pas-s25]
MRYLMHPFYQRTCNHLGVGKSTLDKWIRQLDPNKTSCRKLTAEQQRIMALEKEMKELKMANDILKRRMCTSSTIQVGEVRLYEKSSNSLIPLPRYVRCLESVHQVIILG